MSNKMRDALLAQDHLDKIGEEVMMEVRRNLFKGTQINTTQADDRQQSIRAAACIIQFIFEFIDNQGQK